MRKLLIIVLTTMLLCTGTSAKGRSAGHVRNSPGSSSGKRSKSGSTTVKGYTKRNGTHVKSYHRTAPDKTQRNNYSTKGNVNPYTGKSGTKKATK